MSCSVALRETSTWRWAAMRGRSRAQSRLEVDGHFVAMDRERGIFRVVLKTPEPDAPAYIDVAALQGTIEEDLRRRDFTIDALAVPIDGGGSARSYGRDDRCRGGDCYG